MERVRGLSLVFDRTRQLTPLSVLATQALQKRLSDASIPWQELDLGGDSQQLPEEWFPPEVPGQYHRCSKSHWLLVVELRRKGRGAELEWSLIGGRLCGSTNVVSLTWEDGAWSGEVTLRARH